MTINSDVDIPLAIEKLGLSKNEYKLSSSLPPHNIVEWTGSDSRPSDDQINTAWTNWKSQDKYKGDREASYPSWKDQLDQLYWDKKNGTNKWVEAIDKVKSDNPKP
tara:strand:- start:737 stop:1054 length:318 start_codon:yes stop_codon:yes gene_type:complete